MDMIKRPGYLFLFCIICLGGCSSSKTYIESSVKEAQPLQLPEDEGLIYRVYLIGDAGAPSLNRQEPTFRLFESLLKEESERSAAVFLGDNIYLNGLPEEDHPRRAFYESRLTEQLKTVDNYKGRVFFIPGNHDWDNGGRDGLNAVLRQEKFVEEYLDRGNTFIPDRGFPGPHSVKLLDDNDDPRLREDIRLIALDTQWWLHRYDKSYGDNGEFEVTDAGDIITELDDILKKQRNDFLLIAAHHPLFTNGPHGGYVNPSVHYKYPIAGSLYALYRRAFGFRQDNSHHTYAGLSRTLRNTFRTTELEHLVYTSGHSHFLQHHIDSGKRIDHHYLVSGAGTKRNYAARGRGASFVHQGQGFMTVGYYADGSVWVQAWVPEGNGSEGKVIYTNRIKEPYDDPLTSEEIDNLPDYTLRDSVVTAAPNPDYDNKNALFEAFIGQHNRPYWSLEAEFPVFDVSKVKGGLTPVRMGGKGQSNTLHLEDDEGNDFVLRSVDKQAGKIWDVNLKKTIALDVAQDQFSILNPYAALVIPELAGSAGVYHTNPELYYVPDDPRLGRYADEIGGQLALFEERPNGDMSSVNSVGNSEEVLSHAEMIREIDGDIDHRVDQFAFARARLLDLLVADWDRHSDQWRWASFEPENKKGKIYVPIPRDRDVAMMKMTGIIPTLAKLGPFFQYQNFDEDYGNLIGLSYNSLPLTRRFTNKLTYQDWVNTAAEMKAALSDEVIEKAVRNYPEPVFSKFGEETIRLLKIRRDRLVEVARRHYEMISGVVTVQGSDKRERFVVDMLNADEVRVQVYKLSGKGELKRNYYERVFKTSETSEIRLVGMDGDDVFLLNGDKPNPVKLNIIGGSGSDLFIDRTAKHGLLPDVYIYDTERETTIEAGLNTKIKTSADPLVNYYNFEQDFAFDRVFAGVYTSYNGDDGLFLGGGPQFIQNDFRNHPSSRHYIRANYAPKTGAANIRYTGAWYNLIGKWDMELDSRYFLPKSYKNFFGLGNETTREERRSNYYRARLTRITAEPRFYYRVDRVLGFYAGLGITGTKVDGNDDNIVNDPELNIPDNQFVQLWFGALTAGVNISDVDNTANPKQGYKLMLGSRLNRGIFNTDDHFSTLKAELSVYLSPRIDPQITVANRSGYAKNFGEFPFYESSTLGGTSNLRGYRGDRFAGRSSVYNNLELRVEVLDFYRYLLGGKAGFTVFFDTGRVWSDSEQSDVWHKGYGGGIWFNLFESLLINSSAGFSEEGSLIEISAGFHF